MQWSLKAFSILLKLYPRPFHDRFANEMEGVFQEGLTHSGRQVDSVKHFLRELVHTPASLINAYAWSIQTNLNGQPVSAGANGSDFTGAPPPGAGWGASILAGLPHLLIFVAILGTLLVNSLIKVGQNTLSIIGYIFFSLVIIAALVVSVLKGWKQWSVSWAIYTVLIVLALIGAGATALSKSVKGGIDLVNTVLVLLLSLALAYILYKITSKDRRQGLLAAIAPMFIPWIYFIEYVPVLQKSLSWAWAFLLAFIATVIILRTKKFGVALLTTMAVPVLAGFPIAYLSVYVGGTLPFSEPGPSLQEVFRQYLPFLCLTLTILLAPQLAAKLRQLSSEIAGGRGKAIYRIILTGMLLGLVRAIYQWIELQLSGPLGSTLLWVEVILAGLLFIGGFAYLFWRSINRNQHPGPIVQLTALFILLLCVPVIFSLPARFTYNNSIGSWIVILVSIEWACAAAWVVKD